MNMNKRTKVVSLGLGIFLLLSGLAFAETDLVAPPPKHEISVGLGILTVQEFVWIVGDILDTMFTGHETDQISGSGNFSLSYRYHPSRRLAFGVAGVIENINVTYKDTPEKRSFRTWALMGNVRLKYLDAERLSLYSGLGVGYCSFGSGGDTIAFQVTGFGLSFRFMKNLGFFVELGAGYQGIVNVGLVGRL